HGELRAVQDHVDLRFDGEAPRLAGGGAEAPPGADAELTAGPPVGNRPEGSRVPTASSEVGVPSGLRVSCSLPEVTVSRPPPERLCGPFRDGLGDRSPGIRPLLRARVIRSTNEQSTR